MLFAEIHTETSKNLGDATILTVTTASGDCLVHGQLGYADCPRPLPENVTVEDVTRHLRNAGLESWAKLAISLKVGATRIRI